MNVMQGVPAASLDVQVAGVGVGAGVGSPAGSVSSSPLLALPDDELDVTVLAVGKVSGESVTESPGAGSPVTGTSTRVCGERITATNRTIDVTTEVAAARIGGT